jgi:hypothetical protein
MGARCTTAFVLDTPVRLGSDRALSRQIALHGNYVVEESARLAALPASGSLIIVAPEKDRNAAEAPVRVLAIVSRAVDTNRPETGMRQRWQSRASLSTEWANRDQAR